ncbi:hypothetical protein SAMN04488134_101424 [Amphibacillus marinus]|uniref:Flagellar hook-length control protein-like C-terminal domain-containing protein n=1 Tax=Amphibacillus marinus TaxID=872970 RepID=A0A1H8HS20_9BACI|nr:flagellar hook-length control protein FliK [Amphibacillus marinus]SEN58847.1 hypothetical protein SAMN04488134_101424 [Amphibacillus marinus]
MINLLPMPSIAQQGIRSQLTSTSSISSSFNQVLQLEHGLRIQEQHPEESESMIDGLVELLKNNELITFDDEGHLEELLVQLDELRDKLGYLIDDENWINRMLAENTSVEQINVSDLLALTQELQDELAEVDETVAMQFLLFINLLQHDAVRLQESATHASQVFAPTYSAVNLEGRELNQDWLHQAQDILRHSSEFDREQAKQLLQLLKANLSSNGVLTHFPKVADQTAEGDILEQIMTSFQRKTYVEQRGYKADASVTTTDIMKWVRGAVERLGANDSEREQVFGQLYQEATGHHKLEQYTLHLGNGAEEGEALAQRLLEQMEQTLAKSQFLKLGNNHSQLLLKLTPHALGEINVALTEIDGELIVKLSAVSEMAKEALEANVKELRHLFSPHNILIEKQEQPVVGPEQQHSFTEHDEQEHANQQEQAQQGEEQTMQAQLDFEEILLNERV